MHERAAIETELARLEADTHPDQSEVDAVCRRASALQPEDRIYRRAIYLKRVSERRESNRQFLAREGIETRD